MKVQAVRCLMEIKGADKIVEKERSLTFYFKETQLEKIMTFFDENREAFEGMKLGSIKVVANFASAEEAHKYYLDHFDEPGYQSWPILILDDSSKQA